MAALVISLCGLTVPGNVLALALFAGALCLLLLAGAALGQWLERRYERRQVTRRLRPAPHVHVWEPVGAGRVLCACGAEGAARRDP